MRARMRARLLIVWERVLSCVSVSSRGQGRQGRPPPGRFREPLPPLVKIKCAHPTFRD